MGYICCTLSGTPKSLSAQKYLSWWSVISPSIAHSLWAVPLQASTFKMPLLSVWKGREMVVLHNCLPKFCSVKSDFFFFFFGPIRTPLVNSHWLTASVASWRQKGRAFPQGHQWKQAALPKRQEQGSVAGCVKTAKIKPVETRVPSLEATGKKSAVAIAVKLLVRFNENEQGTELATTPGE